MTDHMTGHMTGSGGAGSLLPRAQQMNIKVA